MFHGVIPRTPAEAPRCLDQNINFRLPRQRFHCSFLQNDYFWRRTLCTQLKLIYFNHLADTPIAEANDFPCRNTVRILKNMRSLDDECIVISTMHQQMSLWHDRIWCVLIVAVCVRLQQVARVLWSENSPHFRANDRHRRSSCQEKVSSSLQASVRKLSFPP